MPARVRVDRTGVEVEARRNGRTVALSVGARRRCRRRQLGGRHRGRHLERRRASHRGRATGLRDGHGQRRRRGDVLVRSVALSRLRLGLSDGRRPGQRRHRHPGRDPAPPGHRHPGQFDAFLERLRASGPPYERLELCSTPIGGVVKTYGGAGPRHLERGVLVGDAGSFVDPMTGEGITPAMESALLAAPVLLDALAGGALRRRGPRGLRRRRRAYFDPSMRFLAACASTLRNPHLARSVAGRARRAAASSPRPTRRSPARRAPTSAGRTSGHRAC